MRLRMTTCKSSLIALAILVTWGTAAQQIIENPDKPLALNAGRILKLQEIWRIADEGGRYYFKAPSDLHVSLDGCLFLADDGELLKFSPDGKFIKNLLRRGQGPGEIAEDFFYTIDRELITIYDFIALKIVQLDLDGKTIRQTKIETGPYSGFYGIFQNQFVFRKEIPPPPAERKPGLQTIPVAVRLVSDDGKSEKEDCSFQKEMSIEGNQFATWTKYLSILDDKNGRIYVSDTREYLIRALDLEAGRTIKLFKRKYLSVPYKERGWEQTFYKNHNIPKIRIEADISDLFINENRLWVKTSTKTPEIGDLFDVFDDGGRYVDCFYLGSGRTLLKAIGDKVFVLDKNADDTISLVKCKIVG